MSSPALATGWRRAARTVAQVAAGGALTALVTAIAGGLDPTIQGLVLGAWTALIAGLQNWLEAAGAIPTLLPTPAVVVGPVADLAVGTVEAVADKAGEITGDVLDTAGKVIGGVTGQTDQHNETGRVGPAILVIVAAIVLMFVAFDACIDDEDEVDDLGQGVELVASDGDDNRGGRNKNGRDCEGSQDCSSFSPSFEDSPVILCLPNSVCNF
jgi:hypothetical protein